MNNSVCKRLLLFLGRILPVEVGSCKREKVGEDLDSVYALLAHVVFFVADGNGDHLVEDHAAAELIYSIKNGVVGKIVEHRVRLCQILVRLVVITDESIPCRVSHVAHAADGDDDNRRDEQALDKTNHTAEDDGHDASAVADSSRESGEELVE